MLTSYVYLAISYPFLGLLLYFARKYNLRTWRQLRLLDLGAKTQVHAFSRHAQSDSRSQGIRVHLR